MTTSIKTYCDEIIKEFDSIPTERKILLEKISAYIQLKKQEHKPIQLVYVCTHNSRRSHFGQIWAQVAAHYYKVNNVQTFSGGTEATAFNINAINSVKRVGFDVKKTTETLNPIYPLYYEETDKPISCFSKVYHDDVNPKYEFAAIMTCSDAEENCPLIPGVELRIGTTYDDPKAFDNTPLQDAKYDERCKQIALETFYVFSKIN
jgi:protein-tyrosine phosphatase/arsenate reductase